MPAMKLGFPLAIGFVLGVGAVPGCVCSKSDERPAPTSAASAPTPTPVGIQHPFERGRTPMVHVVPIPLMQVDAGANKPQ
jgi:hypothetical protein